MNLLDLFRKKPSAPVARERLQVLLAHERGAHGQSELLAKLQEEILQVIAKHIKVSKDQVHIKVDRADEIATLEIDVEMPDLSPLAPSRPPLASARS